MIGLLQLFSLPTASSFAEAFEALYSFIFWISWVCFIGIVGAMFWFIWHYHRSKRDPEKTPSIEGHTPLELSMCGILLILVMWIFAWGWVDYLKMRTMPKNALEVNVIGRQWLWEFEYTNGRKMMNELVVPVKKSVKLIMSSADVLHSFFVPAFRIKQDLLPNAYTAQWFEATTPGEYVVYCAEYCGTSHSNMIAKIRVVPENEYQRWQLAWEVGQQLGESTASTATPTAPVNVIDKGKALFQSKACTACHTVDGKPLVGPSLLGFFGSDVELADGTKIKADENYVRESLMDPTLKVVKGFQPIMPTMRGQLTDDEVNALMAYVKSLGK